MQKSYKIPILVAAGIFTVLAVAAAYTSPAVSFQSAQRKGARVGEVLIAARPVIVLSTAAGGLTPLERAEVVAGRLRTALASEVKPAEVTVSNLPTGAGLSIRDQLIVAVYQGEANAHQATPTALAKLWRENILLALGYQETDLTPPADPPQQAQEPAQPKPAQQPAPPPPHYADWTGSAQKWVPVLSVEREGIQVGMAQVAGPPGPLDEVKAVYQLRLDFRSIGRAYVYVPVRTISVTKINRVQGVSVWALADIKVLGF
jgi:hypothetical protein